MIEFNYLSYELPDRTLIARPVIDCSIINPITKKGIYVAGILDSGSDYILMSRTLALHLGFDLNDSNVKQISGLGSSIKTITCNAKLNFSGTYTLSNAPIEVCIDESDETMESIQIIFGRRGLFSEFDIEFKREGKITFKK